MLPFRALLLPSCGHWHGFPELHNCRCCTGLPSLVKKEQKSGNACEIDIETESQCLHACIFCHFPCNLHAPCVVRPFNGQLAWQQNAQTHPTQRMCHLNGCCCSQERAPSEREGESVDTAWSFSEGNGDVAARLRERHQQEVRDSSDRL